MSSSSPAGDGADDAPRPVGQTVRQQADDLFAEAERPASDALLLAMDTASPTVSVAVGRDGVCLAERSVALRRSSESLLRLVDEALGEAGVSLGDLDGVVALRGPGSFTGLRVGLATVLGLHQARGLPATALPTLEVIEAAARAARPGCRGTVASVVDALRGQWFTQLFPAPGLDQLRDQDGDRNREANRAGDPTEAAILTPEQVAARRPALVAGFGAARLAADTTWPEECEVLDLTDLTGRSAPADRPARASIPAAGGLPPAAGARTLAAAALALHARPPRRPPAWHPGTLTAPLYLRPPAVTLPKSGP